jgi:hypothetical protein
MRIKSSARASGIGHRAPTRSRRPAGRPKEDGPRIDDVGAAAISLARCRELLGPEAESRSDEEIDQVRRHAAALASMIVQAFLDDQSVDE